MEYESYHRNPINKFIHTICIPLIVITTINFVRMLTKNINKVNTEMFILILTLYYLKEYNFFIWSVMLTYYLSAIIISDIWMFKSSNFKKETFIVFTTAWIMQFIGHYIEGNRPALFDSITTSFTQAPMYSLDNVINII